MILSGHQPCYLPSLQLFAKMAKSNLFMHCGHLQFQQGSWHHRNYILLNGKRHRLSIPIQRPHIKPINDVQFSDQEWKKQHLRTILQAYGRAPFFKSYYAVLVQILCDHPHSLEKLNIDLTKEIAIWLGVDTPNVTSAWWHFDGDAIDKIIQMCQAVDADRYLSSEGAQDYLSTNEELRLQDAGIYHNWLVWKDPAEKEDPPQKPLSAIHHLFMLGPEAARLIQ